MDKTLEEVLEEYKDLVRAKASLYFIFGADKEDIIQEGMIGLVKAYHSFDNEKGASFGTYAGICIDGQIINAIQAANRKKYSPLNAAVEIPEASAAGPMSNPEDAAIFKDYITSLKENRDGLLSVMEHKVLLSLLEGKDYKQIAAELSKSPKSVDNTIQRIRKKIKEYLK